MILIVAAVHSAAALAADGKCALHGCACKCVSARAAKSVARMCDRGMTEGVCVCRTAVLISQCSEKVPREVASGNSTSGIDPGIETHIIGGRQAANGRGKCHIDRSGSVQNTLCSAMALDFLQNSLLLVFALLPLFSQMQEEIEDLDLGMDKKKKVFHFSPVYTMSTLMGALGGAAALPFACVRTSARVWVLTNLVSCCKQKSKKPKDDGEDGGDSKTGTSSISRHSKQRPDQLVLQSC